MPALSQSTPQQEGVDRAFQRERRAHGRCFQCIHTAHGGRTSLGELRGEAGKVLEQGLLLAWGPLQQLAGGRPEQ
jgi:hypothetical protein